MSDTQKAIEAEVKDALATEKSLQDLEAELMQNEQFRQFIELSKTIPKQLEEVWDRVKVKMQNNNIKSIRGDWGSVTLAEKLSFHVNMDELPDEYIKKAPDLKRIANDYRLEGESPKGTTPKTTRYLVKKWK